MTAVDVWQPNEICPEGVPANVAGLLELVSRIDDLTALLAREKALVFRGFGVSEPELAPVLDALLENRLSYVHGTSPRTRVGTGNVYTSTEYPAELTIPMHSELSYSSQWPTRLLFFCAKAAETGGATPVVDGTRWLGSLDDEVREAFAPGVCYQQNLHDGYGLGRSWQQTFETTDREAVEGFLDRGDYDWSWTGDGGLRMVSPVRPATLRHPLTGAEVWFNQADHFHPAALGDETARELAQLLAPEELPQNVTFADGSAIPDEYILQVRDRGLDAAVDVAWQNGDVMVVDNIAVGHGRRRYAGQRRVLVSMSGAE